MPRTNLAVVNVDADGAAVGATAADAVNNNMFDGGSNVFLVVRNTGAGVRTITIITPATAGGLAIADVGPVNVAAGATMVFGPFPSNIYAQPSGDDVGKVYVNGEHAELLLSPMRLP